MNLAGRWMIPAVGGVYIATDLRDDPRLVRLGELLTSHFKVSERAGALGTVVWFWQWYSTAGWGGHLEKRVENVIGPFSIGSIPWRDLEPALVEAGYLIEQNEYEWRVVDWPEGVIV